MLDRTTKRRDELLGLMPRARTEDLVTTELDDELLVYDLRAHRAHALNPTAARVWQRCDGRHTIAELAALPGGASGTPLGAEVVWLALRQLGERHLLAADNLLPADAPRYSRLQLLKWGAAGGAVLLPVISSIVAPTAAHAQSCTLAGLSCGPGLPPCCSPSTCVAGTCV
jgi:hypothetical protein